MDHKIETISFYKWATNQCKKEKPDCPKDEIPTYISNLRRRIIKCLFAVLDLEFKKMPRYLPTRRDFNSEEEYYDYIVTKSHQAELKIDKIAGKLKESEKERQDLEEKLNLNPSNKRLQKQYQKICDFIRKDKIEYKKLSANLASSKAFFSHLVPAEIELIEKLLDVVKKKNASGYNIFDALKKNQIERIPEHDRRELYKLIESVVKSTHKPNYVALLLQPPTGAFWGPRHRIINDNDDYDDCEDDDCEDDDCEDDDCEDDDCEDDDNWDDNDDVYNINSRSFLFDPLERLRIRLLQPKIYYAIQAKKILSEIDGITDSILGEYYQKTLNSEQQDETLSYLTNEFSALLNKLEYKYGSVLHADSKKIDEQFKVRKIDCPSGYYTKL